MSATTAKLESLPKRQWSLLPNQWSLRSLGIALEHRDGTKGILAGFAQDPGRVRVTFEDGLTTEQRLRDLRLPGGAKFPSAEALSLNAELYDVHADQSENPCLADDSANKRELDDSITAIREWVHFTFANAEPVSQSNNLAELCDICDLVASLEKLDIAGFYVKFGRFGQPQLASALLTILRNQVVGFIIETLCFRQDSPISLENIYETLNAFTEEWADNQFFQTALARAFKINIDRGDLQAAIRLFNNHKYIINRDWARNIGRQLAYDEIDRILVHFHSAIVNGRIDIAQTAYSELKNISRSKSIEPQKILDECTGFAKRLVQCESQDLDADIESLRFESSQIFAAWQVKKLNASVEARLRRLLEESDQKALELAEKYRFLPDSEAWIAEVKKRVAAKKQARLDAENAALSQMLKNELVSIHSTFYEHTISPIIPSRPLDAKSLNLIYKWQNDPSLDGAFSEAISRVDNRIEHDLVRLYTARQAENVALNFLRQISSDVKDISIQQIEDHSSRDWVSHDIEASGRCFDVKSARSSFSSRHNFSEFCVPKFKQSRHGTGVRIFAIFSEYQTTRQIVKKEDSKATVLGEVTIQQLNDFREMLATISSGIVRMELDTRYGLQGNFLPGWLFELPNEVYASNAEMVSRLEEFSERYVRHFRVAPEFETPLAIVAEAKGSAQNGLHSRAPRSMARPFIEAIALHGWNKRSIVAAVLSICLLEAKNPQSKLKPGILKDVLFSADFPGSPLGLSDPLGFVESLIDVFDDIYATCKQDLLKFKEFRLTGRGILQGRSGGSQWRTIIAYCGGWHYGQNVKCGKNPIHIGETGSCPNCGKLICPQCGFCSRPCREREARQELVGQEYQRLRDERT